MSTWQHNSCASVLEPKVSLDICSWSNNIAKFSFHLMDLDLNTISKSLVTLMRPIYYCTSESTLRSHSLLHKDSHLRIIVDYGFHFLFVKHFPALLKLSNKEKFPEPYRFYFFMVSIFIVLPSAIESCHEVLEGNQ